MASEQFNLEIGWTEVLGAAADNPPIPRASGETIFVLCCPNCGLMDDPERRKDVSTDKGDKQIGSGCPRCKTPRHLERYKVPSTENGIKAQFEQWVREGALLAIEECASTGDVEGADRMRSTYIAERREYTWDGQKCLNARWSRSGVYYLAYLMLNRCHPTMTEARAKAIVLANHRGWGLVLSWALGNWESPQSNGSGGGSQNQTQNQRVVSEIRGLPSGSGGQ